MKILLDKTQTIKKYNCEVSISETQDKNLSICQVCGIGKLKSNHWQQEFPSVYGGYAMLMEKYLIDLPGKHFLVKQINEHSRGAHHEYEMYLLDLQGNVLIKFNSGFNSKILLDEKYIWLLVSGEKHYSFGTDRDLNLIKLNYTTGKIKQTIKINYPALLNCPYSYIVSVQLSIKHDKGILQIKYSEANELSTKRIEMTSL